MAHESDARRETVARVMDAFKHGDLDRRDGEPVRDPKQAIAIALHEAGASNAETPAKNLNDLRRTKLEERLGRAGQADAEGGRGPGTGETRAALYAQAKRRNIPGRSKMGKAELAHALTARRAASVRRPPPVGPGPSSKRIATARRPWRPGRAWSRRAYGRAAALASGSSSLAVVTSNSPGVPSAS